MALLTQYDQNQNQQQQVQPMPVAPENPPGLLYSPTGGQAPQDPQTYGQNPMEAAQVQRGDVRDVTAGGFLQGDIQGYMNPYTQNVVDTTMSELDRQRQLVQQKNQDAMAQAGAFGGSRHGILEAETNREFFDVAGQHAAKLYDESFRFGADTMRADMDRAMEASIANQTADVNISDLNAKLQQQAIEANFDAATLARRDATLASYDRRLTELQHAQGLDTDRQRSQLEKERDRLLAADAAARDLRLSQYEKDRDTLLNEQGLKRDTIEFTRREAELAGQQAAGLMAQLIQSIGAINQADMKVEDKRAQINALIQTTASTISGVSDQFNQPGLIEWAAGMIDNIDKAAEAAAGPAPELPAGTYEVPSSRYGGEMTTVRPGDPLPSGYTWQTDPRTGLPKPVQNNDY